MKTSDLAFAIYEESVKQSAEQFAAKSQYRQWKVDNNLTFIIPTYWHGRAQLSRPNMPTYDSKSGRWIRE